MKRKPQPESRVDLPPDVRALFDAIHIGSLNDIMRLLNKEVPPDTRDEHNWTPLQNEAGADINAYDNGGYTIFHQASKAIDLAPGHRESWEVIAMLRERKAWMW